MGNSPPYKYKEYFPSGRSQEKRYKKSSDLFLSSSDPETSLQDLSFSETEAVKSAKGCYISLRNAENLPKGVLEEKRAITRCLPDEKLIAHNPSLTTSFGEVLVTAGASLPSGTFSGGATRICHTRGTKESNLPDRLTVV